MNLQKSGIKGQKAYEWSNSRKGYCRMAQSPILCRALNNEYFTKQRYIGEERQRTNRYLPTRLLQMFWQILHCFQQLFQFFQMGKSLLNYSLILFVSLVLPQRCFAQQSSLPKYIEDASQLYIKWDSASLLKIGTGGYARMIELYDGRLVTVYAASNGNTEIVRSEDEGNHWSEPVIVAAKKSNVRMDAPDITLLHDNSILVCYNPRPSQQNSDTSTRFAIRVARSYDEGLTWKDDQLLYEASPLFKDGCWEPSALQLPSDEIQIFFSNEGIYRNSNEQNISRLRSVDNGKTWTIVPEIVSFRKGSRDGMPTPVYSAEKKEIIFSIEDNGFINFKPYIIHIPANRKRFKTVTSNSPYRKYALLDSLPKSVYAGAPYLRVLANGNYILSYQSTQFRQGKNEVSNAEMVVTVGNSSATNFTNPTVPFKIPAEKRALWNSLTVLKNGTIIALTSTDACSNETQVWMIKGKIFY